MIDLHCHIIPGIDDGSTSLEESLAMAEIAVADGITVLATTSHIFPGMFNNTGPQIEAARIALQGELDARGIPLRLVSGADVQLDLNIVSGLRSGAIPSLNGSRYFLFEPPHNTAPPRIDHAVREFCEAGYVPVVTHPERLTWIEDHYDKMAAWVEMGAWMQLTAASVTGVFGPRAQAVSERLMDDGLVHIVATDAHNTRRRKPVLSKAREAVALRLGETESWNMVLHRPRLILENADPALAPPPVGRCEAPQEAVPAEAEAPAKRRRGFWPFGR